MDREPSGTDTATAGIWEWAASQATSWSGTTLQLASPAALVTGPLAGASAGTHDIDGGVTTLRSPAIALPSACTLALALSLSWYLAHRNDASAEDHLRVSVQHDGGTTVVLDRAGSATNRSASWTGATADLTPYTGQTSGSWYRRQTWQEAAWWRRQSTTYASPPPADSSGAPGSTTPRRSAPTEAG